MADHSPPNSTIPAPLAAAGDRVSQSIKAVGDAIMDLNIARKNMLIYPPQHEQVQRSLKRACVAMHAAAAHFSPLTLTVMQEHLMVGTHALETKGALSKELAQALKQRGIAAITLFPNFENEELVGVLKLMNLDPDQIKGQGGIEMASAAFALSRIVLHTVDYSKLHVTEEEEIRRSAGTAQEESTWGLFVSHMLAGTLAVEGAESERAQALFDPVRMADLLNANQADAKQAVDYYQAMIAEYLRPEAQDAPLPTLFNRNLESFHRLVKELNPELQQQFLSSAFDQCAQQPSSGGIDAVMSGLGADMVVEMLRQANTRGKQISPSLLAFVRKMGIIAEKPGPGVLSAGPHPEIQAGVQALLGREKYETYVDEAYDRMLKKLSERPADQVLPEALGTLKQAIEATLEEPHISILVAGALNGLMAASIDAEEYRDWARQLTFLLDDLISLGAFGALAKIFDALHQTGNGAIDGERQKINALVLDHFHSAEFAAKAVAAYPRSTSSTDRGEAIAFLERLGEAAVIEALESIGVNEPFDPNGGLMQILTHLAPQAVKEALERLRDPRPHYLCRMLSVIRFLGRGEDVEGVKNLLDHADTEVRMEALATMLNFNNPWAVLHLRELLAGPWSDAVQRAMQLAGAYKVREVVSALLGIVDRAGPLGSDMEKREAALRALGHIGDSQAVGALTKIAARRWSLSQKHLNHLKRVLYESLEGYPHEAVRELLHMGLRQKDQSIVATCERLMKKYHISGRLKP
ncbi:MAG: hypothetical protein WAU91_13920 [Desulfatitalea sp.]